MNKQEAAEGGLVLLLNPCEDRDDGYDVAREASAQGTGEEVGEGVSLTHAHGPYWQGEGAGSSPA